jgi:hypothetical protein
MSALFDYIYDALNDARFYDIEEMAFLKDKDGMIIKMMSKEEVLNKIEDESN